MTVGGGMFCEPHLDSYASRLRRDGSEWTHPSARSQSEESVRDEVAMCDGVGATPRFRRLEPLARWL